MEFCQEANHTFMKDNIINMIKSQKTDLPLEIHNLIIVADKFTHIINQSNHMYHPRYRKLSEEDKILTFKKLNVITLPDIDMTLGWTHKYLYLYLQGELYICPKSILLMYHNKLADAISVLLLAYFSQGINLPEYTYRHTLEFIIEMIELLLTYKNSYFTIIKALEGLVTGETLVEIEGWDNKEFLIGIDNELHRETSFEYYSSKLRTFIINCPIPLRHELACLSKLLGHPLVDMEKGAQKLFEKTNDPIPINLENVLACINHCKADYIKKSVSRHKKWPPSTIISSSAPKALVYAKLYGKDPDCLWIRSRYGSVKIQDYVFVELLPNMVFSKLENIIPYLKDKTISLMKSSVLIKYINRTKEGERLGSWQETRLLLAYLLNPSMVHDHVKYLDTYTESDDLEELLDYLVIRIVPKEKELKIDFRGFGCKTFEDRMRSMAQEKATMKYLDEFSDEQAMTLSELALIRKLDAFRRLKLVFKDHEVLYIVIDSAAWNNRFRDVTVDCVMEHTLSRIFGTNIFNKTHLAFNKTFFYVPDNLETYYWEGQGGGIEGLNQDTWVVTYLSMIKVAIGDLGYKYHVLCKGDDLRVMLLIPKEHLQTHNLRDLKLEIVTKVSRTLRDFGHKINIEESYGSSRFLAFSKEASIDTIVLPQSYRKIQKAHGANNAFINTLDDYIAAAFSNAHSACKTSPVVSGCYKVAVFWSTWYIKTCVTFKDLELDSLVALMMIPNLAGGFPIIYLHNMVVRAESDLFSPFIALYQYCQLYEIEVAKIIAAFMVGPIELPDRLDGLFCDPYSLPSTRPTLAATVLRHSIIPILKKETKNEDIKELFRLIESGLADQYVDALNSCTVVRTKALNILYSATPLGVLDMLIKKFEAGRSVLELLLLKKKRKSTNRILRKVIKADKKVLDWRLAHLRGLSSPEERSYLHLLTDCPAESAYLIRQFLWGRPIEDVTLPPMQHQVHLMPPIPNELDTWVNQNHFTFFIKPVSNMLPGVVSEHYMVGNSKPFLGYTTPSGTLHPNIHFLDKDAIVSKVKQLLDISSWLNIESYIDEDIHCSPEDLINKILSAYTSLTLKDLLPYMAPRKSGTQNHHLKSTGFKDSIVPNTLGNTLTRITGESNTHIVLKKSPDHFLVNFLHIFCYCSFIMFSELEVAPFSSITPLLWGVTTDCPFCTSPIEEERMLFSRSLTNSLPFIPMAITKIGTISENILKASLDMHKTLGLIECTDRHRQEGRTLSLADASIGIIQEFIDTTFRQRLRLQDRFGSHANSPEEIDILQTITQTTSPKTVGLTELKRLDANMVAYHILEVVSHMLPTLCNGLKADSVLEYLNITPVTQIPWHALVIWLHQANRLSDVIRQIGKITKTHTGLAYANVQIATRYIGTASRQSVEDRIYMSSQKVVYLSYYQQEHFRPHIQNCLIRCGKKWTDSQYPVKQALEAIKSEIELASQAALDCLEYIIVAYSLFERTEEDWYDLTTMALESADEPIAVFDDTYFSEDLFYTARDDFVNSFLNTPFLRKILIAILQYRDEGLDVYLENIEDRLRSKALDLTNHPNNPKFTIIITTLPECIQTIREKDDEDLETSSEVGSSTSSMYGEVLIEPGTLILPNLANLTGTTFDGISCIGGHAEELGHHIYTECQELLVHPWYTLSVNPAWYRRHTGRINPSTTTLIDILTPLNLQIIFNECIHLNFLCLSDGIGGFSEVFDILTYKSTIVYHTMVEDFTQDVRPCFDPIEENSNVLIYDYLNQGIYDLTHQVTWTTFETLCPLYHIITCDIECNIFDPVEYEELIFTNILLNGLPLLHTHGIMIIRVDLHFTSVVHSFWSLFKTIFDKSVLLHPSSETHPYAAYLIGLNLRHPIEYDWLLVRYCVGIGGSPLSLHQINGFLARLNRYFEELSHIEFEFDLELQAIKPLYASYHNLPRFGLTTLTRLCGIYLTEEQMLVYKDQSTALWRTQNDWEDHGFILWNHLKRLMDNLKTLPITFNQSWDPNTRAHQVVLLQKIFEMKGLTESLLRYQGFANNVSGRYTNKWVLQTFNSFYLSFGKRYRRTLDYVSLPLMTDDPFDNDKYLYLAFLRGIHCGLSILGSARVSVSRKRIRELILEDQKTKNVEDSDEPMLPCTTLDAQPDGNLFTILPELRSKIIDPLENKQTNVLLPDQNEDNLLDIERDEIPTTASSPSLGDSVSIIASPIIPQVENQEMVIPVENEPNDGDDLLLSEGLLDQMREELEQLQQSQTELQNLLNE
nr:MAG: RNA-dependent RNA polymerase [Hangzhou altica cyanea chuvirus 1]